MRYLLDTNILIFMLSGDTDSISEDVTQIISDHSNLLFTSSQSVIEIIYLFKSKKIKTAFSTSEALYKAISERLYIEILQTKPEHFVTYTQLIPAENHKDQIDHFIISQAICEKLPLVSSDRKFSEYRAQQLDFVYNKR